ncbi:MAG: glycosyltransferase [Flavipsychrobacter sp.]|jgi:glycosyltransferase involved in cell wall biosynthesis|nr:glycosyltransferase [Flavipsychrobacter sp.]
MPDLPLVSVVSCSYNNSKYILDTLNSIKAQTYPNIELVIVDDCSTDNSVTIIKKWLKSYTGIYKFIQLKKNMAGGVSYNIGLQNATGKYYTAVDTDDVILPEKIAIQVKILEESDDDVAAVYSDAYLIDVKGLNVKGQFIQRHRKFTKPPSGDIYHELLKGNYIPVLSLLIKRKVFDELGGYDGDLVYGDYDMWLRIAAKYKILFSDYVSGKYRIRPGSLTNTIKNWEYSNARIFSKHIDAPLPIRWLYDIAWKAYLNKDLKTLSVIREIAARINDRILMANYLLGKFDISRDNGELIITRIHKYIANGLSPLIVNGDDSDVNVFLNEIIHSISYELQQKIICDGYLADNENVKLLLDELAIKTESPYFITASMLWKMGIPYTFGEPLLKVLSEKIGEKINSSIRKVETGHSYTTIGNRFELGSDLFIDEIMPYLNDELLLSFAYNAYANDNKKAIGLARNIVKKNNDRMLQTSGLLWEMNLPSAIKKELLEKVRAAIKNGLSPVITKNYSSNMQMFMKEVFPLISEKDYQKIATEIYYSNAKILAPVVKKMERITGSRYFKAVLRLWRFKINAFTGAIILDRIDDYCKRKLNNFYIDLCIYKDIGGAIKTRNSDLFR